MQLSIREAKARLSEAVQHAARGETVTLTRRGQVVARIVPAADPPPEESFWQRAERVRRELGLDKVTIELPENFDDPAFSRRVLGLED